MTTSIFRQLHIPDLSFRAAVEPQSINHERRTVDVIWSSGAGVLRDHRDFGVFLERLSLHPAHVRLDRLNAGAPVLDSHDPRTIRNVIAVVEDGTARTDGRMGMATLRFSRRSDAEGAWMDVVDRIVRSVSIGYAVAKYQEEPAEDGQRVLTAIKWTPHEISLVAIGADPAAQVRRPRTDADRERELRFAKERDPFPPPMTDADRDRAWRLAVAQGRRL